MRIAILSAPLYEDVELLVPYYRLLEAGHDVELVGCESGTTVEGKRGTSVVTTVSAADAGQVDGVIIPGGYSPDHMRRCPAMVELVERALADGSVVAAICHGPWMLASAADLAGRRLTSFFSIRDDLENAGAEWVDEAVVIDGNVITSRTPDDLPAFMRAVVSALEG